MTVVDFLIVGIVIISMIYGLIRGFLKEVISLGSWILGVWAALTFSSQLAPKIIPNLPFVGQMDFFADSLLRQTILMGALIFFGFAFVGAVVNYLVTKLAERTGLGGMNRFLGMIFGAARGLLIVSVGALFIINSPLVKEEPVWAEAKLRPYAEKAALWLEGVLPDSVLAYLPGRDESYGMLNGVQSQALFSALQKQGMDLNTLDLSQMDVSQIDLSALDSEKLDEQKAREYLMQLQRHQKKEASDAL